MKDEMKFTSLVTHFRGERCTKVDIFVYNIIFQTWCNTGELRTQRTFQYLRTMTYFRAVKNILVGMYVPTYNSFGIHVTTVREETQLSMSIMRKSGSFTFRIVARIPLIDLKSSLLYSGKIPAMVVA